MSAAKPCKHARWNVVKRTAESDHTYEGAPAPGPRQRFRVLEVLRCVKCNVAGTRWSRFYGQTERAALKRAGVPEHDLPAPPNHRFAAEPVTARITNWPFPVSAHDKSLEGK